MRRLWTIIGSADIPTSLSWYQELLRLPKVPQVHEGFCQVIDDDGLVLLCLHSWREHDHPSLIDPEPAAGNGLLLFFRVDDFDGSLEAARRLVPKLEEEPSRNPATGTMEFALRDPDGYYVMVSALEG